MTKDAAADLVRLVDQMVTESGEPEGFSAEAWVEEWLASPVPALGGRRPRQYLATAEGREQIRRLLLQAMSGAYG